MPLTRAFIEVAERAAVTAWAAPADGNPASMCSPRRCRSRCCPHPPGGRRVVWPLLSIPPGSPVTFPPGMASARIPSRLCSPPAGSLVHGENGTSEWEAA